MATDVATEVPLTKLETRVLLAVEEYILAKGVSPTIAELAEALKLKSKGTVHRYVQSLIDKGRLRRAGRGWRGLRVVGLPMPDPVKLFRQVRGENIRDARLIPGELSGDDETALPLLGRIAAGLPIEAIEQEETFDMAGLVVGSDRYALRVSGDSMVTAGILDGDTVLLKKQKTANVGDIVVALIDGQEATLKRLGRQSDKTIELVPDNPYMQPMQYAANRVTIQGVLVGQMRTY